MHGSRELYDYISKQAIFQMPLDCFSCSTNIRLGDKGLSYWVTLCHLNTERSRIADPEWHIWLATLLEKLTNCWAHTSCYRFLHKLSLIFRATESRYHYLYVQVKKTILGVVRNLHKVEWSADERQTCCSHQSKSNSRSHLLSAVCLIVSESYQSFFGILPEKLEVNNNLTNSHWTHCICQESHKALGETQSLPLCNLDSSGEDTSQRFKLTIISVVKSAIK